MEREGSKDRVVGMEPEPGVIISPLLFINYQNGLGELIRPGSGPAKKLY